ncbi:MAG TPA: class I SAM-dependent methyltransferase [Aestuariivirgaceae bacterium]|nr:class I SAM-dependent methyltransferase [Aestuariivirgaceae bacterium]
MDDRLAELYARYPALEQVETALNHRVDERAWILRRVPRRAVCAELGVFTGQFAAQILALTNPAKLYMVDPWWMTFGEHYPDWGAYTANGTLPTRAAYEAAAIRARADGRESKASLVVDYSTRWLTTLPDGTLDWVYLDTGQAYEITLTELRLLSAKLKPGGVILGDDWEPDPSRPHHRIFRAVHQFIGETDFRVIFAGQDRQWMLRRLF